MNHVVVGSSVDLNDTREGLSFGRNASLMVDRTARKKEAVFLRKHRPKM